MSQQKVAFITGGNKGIGLETGRQLGQLGIAVVLGSRDPEKGTAAARQLKSEGIAAEAVRFDVTNPAGYQAVYDYLDKKYGRLDILVNNAGYANVSPIETTTDADFRTQFETNFWGVYNVSKAAIPVLREQGGGLIMQFSSVGGRVGGSPGIASYQAAKFAIDAFSRRERRFGKTSEQILSAHPDPMPG